jgi:hypothetical protein
LDNFRVKSYQPGASKFKMMTKKIILLSLVIASCLHSLSQEKPLTKGLKISKSVKIKKQTYKLDAPESMDGALIIIEGNNITVDFNNAVLKEVI